MYWIYFGFLCSILGTIYSIPQLIKIWQTKSAKGVSTLFICIWTLDKLCAFIYVSHLKDIPLMLKYGVSLLIVLAILYLKLKYKKQHQLEKEANGTI